MTQPTAKTFPAVTLADWRAQVEKELNGGSFDKALVHKTIEGLSIEPLYVHAPPGAPAEVRTPNPAGEPAFRICTRIPPGTKASEVAAEIGDGADAVWMRIDDADRAVFEATAGARPLFVLDVDDAAPVRAFERLAAHAGSAAAAAARFALAHDPYARWALRGAVATSPANLKDLGALARLVDDRWAGSTSVMISTLAYHDAGADAADELALALSTGVAYLEALLDAGLTVERAAAQIAVQVSSGRDTFLELCKVRALRTCWRKLLTAAGAKTSTDTLVHAVCSSRALAVRDPWVNLLRVTTQVFTAALGAARLITPNAFDRELGTPSALGRRVARNTGLVLRDESFLGKVVDPAGGSYYLETLTDGLAREAWKRFRSMEQGGGIAALLSSGRLRARLEAAWRERLDRIAKRKLPVVGVSEFPNLDEERPKSGPASVAPADGTAALPGHRDAEAFEALRARVDSMVPAPEVLLSILGDGADARPRVGFAEGFFAAGGIRARTSASNGPSAIVCLCGTDEQYAAAAARRARELKAAGSGRVLLAGRPGALEASLREAGVDGFIYVGCDVVGVLSDLLGSGT